MAASRQAKYIGSTSTLSKALSQIYFALSGEYFAIVESVCVLTIAQAVAVSTCLLSLRRSPAR